MGKQVLNLLKPGKLWATAENEETTTFHLVIPKDAYTKDRLTANPAINSADELMQPWTVSWQDAEKAGRAELDLGSKKTGRAKQIIGKLSKRFEQGLPPIKSVRGIVLVTARKGNRVPAKQLADVIDFDLGPLPKLKLTAVKKYVTAQQFKRGTKHFLFDLVAQSVGQVQLVTSPGVKISVAGGPSGNGKVQFAAQDARKYRVQVAVPFRVKKESHSIQVPPAFKVWRRNGWRTGGRTAHYDARRRAWVMDQPGPVPGITPAHTTQKQTMETWTGGDVTVTASGVGDFSGFRQSVKCRAESWASGWLNGPPPPAFRHNVC